MQLKACDIFFTHGEGALSKAIRWFSRSPGEAKTETNHVGIVVDDGTLENAGVVEALSHVRYGTLPARYRGKRDTVSVWRPANLTKKERAAIVSKARGYIGRDYGWLKLGLHALGLQRFAKLDKWPICSYLVGKAYGVVGKEFGRDGNELTPDDILDFCQANPDKYTEVMPWTQL